MKTPTGVLLNLVPRLEPIVKPMQKTYLEDMLNLNSIEKLQIEYIDEEDGTGTIHIEWDDTDPDLQWWTDLAISL